MPRRVCITATGARTPLGLHSAPAAAALRAGVSRLAEHPFMIDQAGDPMPAAMDSTLDPALFGFQRFVELAKSALEEVTASLPSVASAAVPLYLALPEVRPGFSEEDAIAIRSALPCSEVNLIIEGHAAGLAAFQLATGKIESGELEACLVGGVESYFHPDTMEWLDSNRQLIGSVSRSGFVPGEGAGVCLLLSETVAYRHGLRPLAWVAATATGRETKLIKTTDVCFGEGLTAVVKEATGALEIPAESVTDIICDMNSERYRERSGASSVCGCPCRWQTRPDTFLLPIAGAIWELLPARSSPCWPAKPRPESTQKAPERYYGPVPKAVSEAPCSWSLIMSFSVCSQSAKDSDHYRKQRSREGDDT